MTTELFQSMSADVDLWYERAREQRARADAAEIELAFWKPIGISSIVTAVLCLVTIVVLRVCS